LHYEKELHDALYADLKKSAEESWVTETGFVLSEIYQTGYLYIQPYRCW
jgi:aldehyde dehydrogenase (NAD+)